MTNHWPSGLVASNDQVLVVDEIGIFAANIQHTEHPSPFVIHMPSASTGGMEGTDGITE